MSLSIFKEQDLDVELQEEENIIKEEAVEEDSDEGVKEGDEAMEKDERVKEDDEGAEEDKEMKEDGVMVEVIVADLEWNLSPKAMEVRLLFFIPP